jgi:hypothetical protein
MNDPMLRAAVISATKKAMDAGCLIEVGWLGLRLAAMDDNAPQIQLDECRQAFFAGAQHVFGSMMATLDEGEEPTQADLNRLSLIADELDRFIEDFSRKHGLPPP